MSVSRISRVIDFGRGLLTYIDGDLGGEADSTRQTTAPNARTSSERNNGGGFFHKLGSLRLPGFRRSADVEGAMKKVASLDESGGSSSPSTRPKKSSKKKTSSLDKSSSVETPESPDGTRSLNRIFPNTYSI